MGGSECGKVRVKSDRPINCGCWGGCEECFFFFLPFLVNLKCVKLCGTN